MKKIARSLLMLCIAASASAQLAPVPIDYRFDEVRRTVTLTSAAKQRTAAKGNHAQSGDKVHTGWFSYALIASEHYRARFEIFSSTDVQLAGGTPGVILSLERGRLHAMFDKITGNEPRVVQTPGALLAVRGTQYSVEVDKAGQTTLDVFEGVVEVRSELQKEPLLVRAGEESTYTRREPPRVHPMPPNRMPDGSNRRGDDAKGHGRGEPSREDGHGPGQPPGGRTGMPPPGSPPKPPPNPPPPGHH